MEVSGEIAMADAQRACAPLGKRLYGWKRLGGLAYLIPALFLGLLAQTVVDWFIEGGFGIIAFFATLAAGTWVAVRQTRNIQRRAWEKRGVPSLSTIRYRATDEGLHFIGPLAETRLSWAGLTEIAPGGQAWLFIGQGVAHFLPKRIFSGADAECAFLAECLARMTPQSRARSVEALVLVPGR